MRKSLVLLALLISAPALAQTYPFPKATTRTSVSIVSGSTFQTLLAQLAPGAVRASLTIENNNTNGDNCWITVDGGTATKGNAILLTPGGSYTRYYPFTPANLIQGTCASNGDTIYVDNQ